MAVKAVFFDMDGTLLTDNRTVRPSTIEAINVLKQQGVIVGLATGRNPRFVLPYMASLGLDVAICYNGQYILSREGVLFQQTLTRATVEGVIAYAQQADKELALGTSRGLVGSGILDFGMGRASYAVSRLIPKAWTGFISFVFNRLVRLVRPRKTEQLSQWLDEPIYQLVLLATATETNRLEKVFSECQFTRSSPYAADVVTRGTSKLTGIVRVGQQYGFDCSETMVFGDAQNDVEMLEGVGYSVAMGNGSASAKQAARYVTDTNNRDGILQAVKYFGLVGE